MRSILSRGIIHRRDMCVNIAVCPAYGVLRVVGDTGEMEKGKILLDIACMNRG